jgi:hypothetical protein
MGSVLEEPEALDGNTLFGIFQNAPQLRKFLDSVEEYVQGQTDETLTNNGFERRDGAKRRTWKGGESEVAESLESLGLDPFVQVLKSPAKIQKEAGGYEVIASLINTDNNKPKIVCTKEGAKTFKVTK